MSYKLSAASVHVMAFTDNQCIMSSKLRLGHFIGLGLLTNSESPIVVHAPTFSLLSLVTLHHSPLPHPQRLNGMLNLIFLFYCDLSLHRNHHIGEMRYEVRSIRIDGVKNGTINFCSPSKKEFYFYCQLFPPAFARLS
jgi:hypothetical protein